MDRMERMKSTGWRWRVALNPVREDFAGVTAQPR
jgi:hypothetical protein